MQVAQGSKFKNSRECLRFTLSKEGWFGLTRGIGATMIREIPGNSFFFTSYEILRRYLPGRPEQRGHNRSFGEILADATSAILCGGAAGMMMWCVILPLDVAKTRLQTASPGDKYDLRISQQLLLVLPTTPAPVKKSFALVMEGGSSESVVLWIWPDDDPCLSSQCCSVADVGGGHRLAIQIAAQIIHCSFVYKY